MADLKVLASQSPEPISVCVVLFVLTECFQIAIQRLKHCSLVPSFHSAASCILTKHMTEFAIIREFSHRDRKCVGIPRRDNKAHALNFIR